MKEIKIGQRCLGPKQPPFVVAELSGNHNQSLVRALEIVKAAARSGANGLKLQTYTPDTMTLNLNTGDFFISDSKSLWKGRSLYDLYSEAYTPWEWHKPIFDLCNELGMVGFSTPFDETSVDFLESLNVPCYKIASFENTDIPLIRKVAKTKKPVVISTGMATLAELDESISCLKEHGCDEIIVLKCTSAYPADPREINLATIPHLRDLFDVQVGLSDHTMGCGVAAASVALGATFIEKHFTLRRADGGVDSAFSMEPDEFRILVDEAYKAWQARGTIHYGQTESEIKSLQFRRSLYISKKLKAGDMLTKENVRCVRPGGGLPPKYLDKVLGKKINRDVDAGTPVQWDIFG